MKKIVIILVFLPFLSKAQLPNHWYLLLHNKIVASGNVGQQQNYVVAKKNIGALKLKFASSIDCKNYNKTFIIMDTLRQEVFRKNIVGKKALLEIREQYFGEQNSYKPLIVYIISKPINDAIAATVRLKPEPLLKIAIKD